MTRARYVLFYRPTRYGMNPYIHPYAVDETRTVTIEYLLANGYRELARDSDVMEESIEPSQHSE